MSALVMLLACSQILVNFSLSVLIEKVFIYKKKSVIERNVYGSYYEPKTKRRELTGEEDCIAQLMRQK